MYDIDGRAGFLLLPTSSTPPSARSLKTPSGPAAALSEAIRVAQMGHWEYDVLADTFTFNDRCCALHRTTAKEASTPE